MLVPAAPCTASSFPPRHRLTAGAFALAAIVAATTVAAGPPIKASSGPSAGKRIERTGFSVRSPTGEWKAHVDAKQSAPTDIMFERRNDEFERYRKSNSAAAPARVGVQLLYWNQGGADTPEHFVQSIENDLRGPPRTNVKPTELTTTPYTFKGAECVRYKATTEYRLTGLFAGNATAVARGFFCRHPSSPLTVAVHAAVRSSRYPGWDSIDAKGEKEADAFLASVEFVPLPKAQ